MRRDWYIFIAILLLIASCSVDRNYRTLSLFFDGVPDPTESLSLESPLTAETNFIKEPGDSINIKFSRRIYHLPYTRKECSACHLKTSVGDMIMEEPGLCYQCHERFEDQFDYLHGPVQGGFCTSCHNPHSSSEASLIVKPEADLCMYCHNQGDLSVTPSHDIIPGMSCIKCHNPHGGSDLHLLRRK